MLTLQWSWKTVTDGSKFSAANCFKRRIVNECVPGIFLLLITLFLWADCQVSPVIALYGNQVSACSCLIQHFSIYQGNFTISVV